MGEYSFFLADDTATARLATRIAPLLRVGDCVLLIGDIGAGKTAFARTVIRTRLNREEDVPSPTFTLVQTYDAPDGDIWHCDLYRLTSPDEAFELGLDDALRDAICLIEWPDRLSPDQPVNAIHLTFQHHGEGRQATLHIPDDMAARFQSVLANA